MTQLARLCVFCGSSPGTDAAHLATARRLGEIMAAEGVDLVFGGGNVGLMGEVSSTVMACGGRAYGIIPEHLQRIEVAANNLTDLVVVDSMHTRKRRMFDMADAFCVLPGGFGTMDELFEILTWRQLALHEKPIAICAPNGFWQPLEALVDHIIEGGFARAANRRLLSFVGDVEQVLPTLRARLTPGTEAAHPERF